MLLSKVINLESRQDRWTRLQPILANTSTKWERYNAIKTTQEQLWNSLSRKTRAEFKSERKTHPGVHSIGAVGCYLSHLAVWKEFLASDKPYLAVLEDDIASISDAQIENGLQLLESSDIVLLGYVRKPCVENGHVKPWPNGPGFTASHAYMLTRRAAELLVKHAMPIEMQVDFYLQAIAYDYQLKIRMIQDPIKQARTGSDVFSLCILCESSWIYAGFLLLVLLLVLYVSYKQKWL